MAYAATFEGTWQMLQETQRLIRENSAETERRFREGDQKFRDSERKIAEEKAETERKIAEEKAETERKIAEEKAETERLMREERAETQRIIRAERAETERLMRESKTEMDRILKNLARQVGSLSSRWGEFVEGVVAPGCVALFAQRGIPVHQIYPRVKARLDDGRMMEIDILVVNSASAVLVEVKSKLTVADVRDHLLRLEQFKLFFPRYADVRVMGAVAGIVSEEEAEIFAHNQGLFVIVQSGETIRLANGESFIPRTW